MKELIALRKELEAERARVASQQQKLLEEQRTQTLQLRAVVDALRGAEVERG